MVTVSRRTVLLTCCLFAVSVYWFQSQPVTVSATFVPPATVTFASIAPVATSVVAAQYGQPGLFAMKTAIDMINNKSAAWRADPTLPKPLCPYTTIQLAYYDSKNSASTTVNAAYDAINVGGAIAIFGEWASTLAPLVQYVAQRYHVPQISSTTALDFTLKHNTDYPYFARVQPSVGLQALEMTHLIKRHFGWNKFVIIGATDAYGAGGTQIMVQTAAQLKMTLLAQISFNLGEADLTFHIQRLVETDARIIAFWSGPGDWINLVRQIRAGVDNGLWPNILGDGYQWILNISPTAGKSGYSNSTGSILPDVLESMYGMIGLSPWMDVTTPEYKEYATLMKSQSPWSVTPLVNPASIGPAAVYAYDATMQMVRGLDFMLENELDPTIFANRADFYQAIRNRTFTGATGWMELDNNGDRLVGYAVVNFQRATKSWVNIGLVSATGDYTAISTAPPVEFLGSDETKYQQPPDTPPRTIVQISNSIKTGVIATSCVLIGLFVVAQLLIFYYRNHNLIKGSSPIFLQLFVVGVQLLCASTIPRALEGQVSLSPHPCEADLWLANLGYTLLVGALFVKTYRLQLIFNMTKLQTASNLGDNILLAVLGGFMLAESVLLLGLQYGAPISSQLATYDTSRDYYSCRAGSGSDQVASVYLPATITTRFALLFATAIMAFRVRNIPDMFNESHQLLVTVYNLLFMSVLLPAIDGTMGRGKENSIIAYATCVFFICTISILIMFVPKFMTIYAGKIKRTTGKDGGDADATQLGTALGNDTTSLPVDKKHTPPGSRRPNMPAVVIHTQSGTLNTTNTMNPHRGSISLGKPSTTLVTATPEGMTRNLQAPGAPFVPSSMISPMSGTGSIKDPQASIQLPPISSASSEMELSPTPAVSPPVDSSSPQPLLVNPDQVHIDVAPTV